MNNFVQTIILIPGYAPEYSNQCLNNFFYGKLLKTVHYVMLSRRKDNFIHCLINWFLKRHSPMKTHLPKWNPAA